MGYPEIGAAPGPYELGRHFGVFDPVMDPSKEGVYSFLDGFLGEMTKLFPDPYFHIGGDEVNGKDWTRSAAVQAFEKEHHLADNEAFHAYFNQRVLKILQADGKIMIGWDEILHPDLPKASVIQSWRGPKGLADAVGKGYQGILSWGYYLDHLSTAAFHYGIDPLAEHLPADQAARVLGGEACMWSEYVSAETVDSRIWPRLAAIAERFWSPAELKDVDSMYQRMAVVSRQLEWTGVRHRDNYEPMLERLAGWTARRPGEGAGRRIGSLGTRPPGALPTLYHADSPQSIRGCRASRKRERPRPRTGRRAPQSRGSVRPAPAVYRVGRQRRSVPAHGRPGRIPPGVETALQGPLRTRQHGAEGAGLFQRWTACALRLDFRPDGGDRAHSEARCRSQPGGVPAGEDSARRAGKEVESVRSHDRQGVLYARRSSASAGGKESTPSRAASQVVPLGDPRGSVRSHDRQGVLYAGSSSASARGKESTPSRAASQVVPLGDPRGSVRSHDRQGVLYAGRSSASARGKESTPSRAAPRK